MDYFFFKMENFGNYNLDTIFYHGSPHFFWMPKRGSYFATFPTLSLAILTEKGNGYGYIYVYRPKALNGTVGQRLVGGLFLTEPADVDGLEADGEDVPDNILISKTDQYYTEYIFDEPDKYLEMFMMYKINIETLRERAIENSVEKTIYAEGEDVLIKEFMPSIDFINVNQ